MKLFLLLPLLVSICETFLTSYIDIQFDRIDIIFQDEKFVDFSKLKVRKVNKTRALIGEFTYKIPMGNDIMIEGRLYKKQGGEYRLMPYRAPRKPYCEANIDDRKYF
jgi:hypothetical protein